jgi:epoxyqueuosine reductase
MIDEKELLIIKQRAKKFAEQIGLPIFGVASPEPLSNLCSLLEKRKLQGLESPFETKWDSEARCRPDLLLSSVRSIICVGMPYYASAAEEYSSWLGISRFARGKDYHLVLKKKLEDLALFLRSSTGSGFEYRTAVDAVPLVERALAHRAGLGWYGKNNLLINAQYGSWFVLGELLTNLQLEPDVPVDADCGDCELCLKACPTGALSGPYQLNSRRCVSCITQVKSDVPTDLREKLGRSVFGCDVCQEVCPRNRVFLPPVTNDKDTDNNFPGEFVPELFKLSEAEFRQKYGDTAFAWLGKDLLQRNAALALGHDGGEKS